MVRDRVREMVRGRVRGRVRVRVRVRVLLLVTQRDGGAPLAVGRRKAHVQPQAVLALGEGVEGVERRHHAGRHLARG